MGTIVFNDEVITNIAKKIAHARTLYGADSAYIIGLFTAVDWLLEGVDNDEGTRRSLRDRVRELDRSETPRVSAPAQTPARSGQQQGGGLVENTWIKGAVKWFNNDKGYGFISTDGNVDVFVHWRDISSWDRSLTQDDQVEFMVTKTAKGFQAINVMKADEQQGDRGEEQREREEMDGADEPTLDRVEGNSASVDKSAPASSAGGDTGYETAGETSFSGGEEQGESDSGVGEVRDEGSDAV